MAKPLNDVDFSRFKRMVYAAMSELSSDSIVPDKIEFKRDRQMVITIRYAKFTSTAAMSLKDVRDIPQAAVTWFMRGTIDAIATKVHEDSANG